MKKICALLLTFIIFLPLLPAAQAAQGDATLALPGESGAAYSLAAMGDTVYLLAPGGLYSWREGEQYPVFLGAVSGAETSGGNTFAAYGASGGVVMRGGYFIDHLLAEDGKLYGLDSDQGDVYLLEARDGQVTVTLHTTLDWGSMTANQGGIMIPGQIINPVLLGGKLYLLRSAQDLFTYELCRFSMEDGKRLSYEAGLIAGFTPYTKGKALILQHASRQDAMARTGKLWLNILDLETGAVTKGVELPVPAASGLAYDEVMDTAAIFAGGEIYTVDHMAECRLAAYAPAAYRGMMGANDAVMLPGGLYAMAGEQIYLRRVARGETIPRALRISGIQEDSYRAFGEKYPQIPVVLRDGNFQSAETLMQDMAGGGSDLYCLQINTLDYLALMEKGFAASIPQSETLQTYVREMYPFIQEELFSHGELAAFPVALSATIMGYSKKALDELGLKEADLPRTIPQMLEFITQWEERFGEDHPSLALFDGEIYGDPTDMFFGWLLETYQAYYQTLGEDLTFDTPLFEKLLAALDSADFSGAQAKDVQQAMASGSRAVSVVTVGGVVDAPATALFTIYHQAVVEDYGFLFNSFEPLPLALDECLDPVIPANLSVYIINPYSQSKDLAIAYLEHFAVQRTMVSRMALSPAYSEPVINPMYEKQKADAQQQLASLASQMETATEDQKKDIQQALDEANNTLAFLENSKWLVSEEDMTAYRERVQSMTVNHINPLALLVNDQGMAALLGRYAGGQIGRVELMKALEEKLQMMHREGK